MAHPQLVVKFPTSLFIGGIWAVLQSRGGVGGRLHRFELKTIYMP